MSFTVDCIRRGSFPERSSVAPKPTIVSGVVNYEVTIDIGKDAELLKPDMTANVTVETAEHKALELPTAAVHRDGEQSFVYLPGKDGQERRPVVVGSKDGGMVEIKEESPRTTTFC